MSDFKKFLAIRKAYAEQMPEWMADYEAKGELRIDPYFMDWQFTPIERNVWCDIRTLGLPFVPQVPVLNYFLDFGCPMLKIGIECDGKAWHDHDLDKARDARLAAQGWMIFRIEGHECMRIVEPWPEYRDEYEEEDTGLVQKFFMTTSEGILTAIKRTYFEDRDDNKYQFEMAATLFEHRSTPETYPVRKPVKPSKPVSRSQFIEDYLERILARAKRKKA